MQSYDLVSTDQTDERPWTGSVCLRKANNADTPTYMEAMASDDAAGFRVAETSLETSPFD
jgi:hypothetical protein